MSLLHIYNCLSKEAASALRDRAIIEEIKSHRPGEDTLRRYSMRVGGDLVGTARVDARDPSNIRMRPKIESEFAGMGMDKKLLGELQHKGLDAFPNISDNAFWDLDMGEYASLPNPYTPFDKKRPNLEKMGPQKSHYYGTQYTGLKPGNLQDRLEDYKVQKPKIQARALGYDIPPTLGGTYQMGLFPGTGELFPEPRKGPVVSDGPLIALPGQSDFSDLLKQPKDLTDAAAFENFMEHAPKDTPLVLGAEAPKPAPTKTPTKPTPTVAETVADVYNAAKPEAAAAESFFSRHKGKLLGGGAGVGLLSLLGYHLLKDKEQQDGTQ